MDTPIIVNKQLQLFLASSSPRRAEILDSLGVSYAAGGVDLDEQRADNESAETMVLRLANEKAAMARLSRSEPVLAADTAVVVDAAVFGKPQNRAEALDMLARLSGRSHLVMTGVALHSDAGAQTALSVSEVTFREIGPDEARAYWQSGEPCDKAGAYAIQGLGGVFVEGLRGSYSGVVGLPVFETAELLAAAGIDIIKSVASE